MLIYLQLKGGQIKENSDYQSIVEYKRDNGAII